MNYSNILSILLSIMFGALVWLIGGFMTFNICTNDLCRISTSSNDEYLKCTSMEWPDVLAKTAIKIENCKMIQSESEK